MDNEEKKKAIRADLLTDAGLGDFITIYCKRLAESMEENRRLFFEAVIIGMNDPKTHEPSKEPTISVIACPDLPLESYAKDRFADFLRKTAKENDAFCVITSSEAWRTVNFTPEQWHAWRDGRLARGESVSMENLPVEHRAEHIWVMIERTGKPRRMLRADIVRDAEGLPHAGAFIEEGTVVKGRFTNLLPNLNSEEFVRKVVSDLSSFIAQRANRPN